MIRTRRRTPAVALLGTLLTLLVTLSAFPSTTGVYAASAVSTRIIDRTQPAANVDSVITMQRDLAGLGYLPKDGADGRYGPQTRAALRAFQRDNGLVEDGSYGPQTDLGLNNKVKEVQRRVGAAADGDYGPVTRRAVAAWQRAHGEQADGVAGPVTMNRMNVARTVQITATNKFAAHGWAVNSQIGCLHTLWNHESNWKVYATNPSSGAYGIPQALPARKMSAAGGDWRTNPATQIEWGEDYIKDRYGTPCAAWAFWQRHHWY